jgi:hypothetical protein
MRLEKMTWRFILRLAGSPPLHSYLFLPPVTGEDEEGGGFFEIFISRKPEI